MVKTNNFLVNLGKKYLQYEIDYVIVKKPKEGEFMQNNLEMIYYIDMETGKIMPFIKEKNSNCSDWLVLKNMITFLEKNSNYSKIEKEEIKLVFKSARYIDLLRKGYSFEEMGELLKNAFFKQYDIPSHKSVLTDISTERECLKRAYQEYQDNPEIEGLTDFVNIPEVSQYMKENMHIRKLRKGDISK